MTYTYRDANGVTHTRSILPQFGRADLDALNKWADMGGTEYGNRSVPRVELSGNLTRHGAFGCYSTQTPHEAYLESGSRPLIFL